MSYNYNIKTFHFCLSHECFEKYFNKLTKFHQPGDIGFFLSITLQDNLTTEHIEKIENRIKKIKIIVEGEMNYNNDKNNSPVQLNLILKNNKFCINHKKISKVCFISSKERTLIILDKVNKKAYYEKDNIPYTLELTEQLQDNILDFKTEFIQLPRLQKQFKAIDEQYKYYVNLSNILIQKTDGRINLFKTGTFKRTALKLLDETTKHINPDKLGRKESKWIMLSSMGQLVFSKKYKGPAWKIDIVSMFPYIISNTSSYIPIKTGKFKKITSEDFSEYINKKLFPVGIYRVKIIKSDDDNLNNLFRYNKNNYYNNIDISYAIFLGLKVEVLDKKINLLYWDRDTDCLKGNEVFKLYVDYLYKLKQDKIEGAKLILNIITGLLGERNTRIIQLEKDEVFDFEKNNLEIIKQWTKKNSDMICYKCVELKNIYKSKFARFFPFLWSKARSMMGYKAKDFKDDILKCNTDSFIFPYKPTQLMKKDIIQMGCFKYEYENKFIEIINNAKEKFIDESEVNENKFELSDEDEQIEDEPDDNE
jgi:hypothetical protein